MFNYNIAENVHAGILVLFNNLEIKTLGMQVTRSSPLTFLSISEQWSQ